MARNKLRDALNELTHVTFSKKEKGEQPKKKPGWRAAKKHPKRHEAKIVKKYFPPLPMSRKRALQLGETLSFIGYQVTKLHPAIIADLAMAEMDYTPESYSVLSLLSGLWQGFMTTASVGFILYYVGQTTMLWIAAVLGVVVTGFMFMRSMMYPAFMVRKRVLEIEKNFLYALRHMLIQVKGGTPLFNSMVSISEAGYGEISEEFARVVREINSGRSITTALEEMGLRNPSIYLRRMVWQIVNSLRTGSDTAKTLEVILDQFTAEQRILLQKFAKELGPWAMMYMMVTVVFPTLGITLFMIISSLSSFQMSEGMLLGFVIFSIVIQYFFIQFLKTKRPVMRW